MPHQDELRWVKSTANELNNLLQVMSESSLQLARLAADSTEGAKFSALLRGAIERATNLSRSMAERAGGETGAPPERPASSVIQASAPGGGIEIHNPGGERELVLIVDDEEAITLLAQHVLGEQGYRVLSAANGFRALEIYRRFRAEIALIILDFTMPVMDGSDVFQELLQIDPNVPVVLSSGFTEQDRLRGMLATGLRGFIPKPYTQEKFLTQIRSTLDALRAERTGERRVL